MKKQTIFLLLLISYTLTGQETKIFGDGKIFKNNISIKPLNANILGVGIGAQYERYLDKTNNFSLVLPINYSFELQKGDNNLEQFGIDIDPGFRFYFLEPRKFNWYLGFAFIGGYSKYNTMYYTQPNVSTISESTMIIFGSTVNIGFKGVIKNVFTYGVEYGLGLTYYNKTKTTKANNIYTNANSKIISQFQVGFGYNF